MANGESNGHVITDILTQRAANEPVSVHLAYFWPMTGC